jgi:methylisocitrate lyase
VGVPVIADAENGFHEPANLWKTIATFEAAGVSAIHIEDHAGGKHTDRPQHLIPLEQMLAKLRAAMEARQNPDFQIIARTDAVWATHDPAEAVRRCRAFAALGVDMVFPTGADADTVDRIRADSGLPVMGIETQDDADRTHAGRCDIALNYGFALYSITQALQQALQRYGQSDQPRALSSWLTPVREFEALFDYHGFTARAQRFDTDPHGQ